MNPAPPDISPRALADLLGRGDRVVLLDVREPFERALCAIPVHPGVLDVHVPLGQVADRVDDLTDACDGRPAVVYCHHGVRSRMVVDWLASRGLGGLHNLAGGIDAWAADVDPLLPRY